MEEKQDDIDIKRKRLWNKSKGLKNEHYENFMKRSEMI